MSLLKFKNKKQAFTLIEMMVAIAVFSLVMVTAMSALINVIDANNKARAIKSAINNIHFALEGISKDMRMGTDYGCIDEDANETRCLDTGNIGIKYRSPRADYDSTEDKNKFAYYRFKDTKIEGCLQKGSVTCISNDFQAITSNEVELTNVKFYVLNVEDHDDPETQPKMIMTVKGEAGKKDKIRTEFDLQTSVSQRIRPLITPTP